MATRRLTPFAKLLLTVVIVGGLFFGGKYLVDSGLIGGGASGEGGQNSSKSSKGGGKTDAETIKIGVVTWGGYAGGEYWNGDFQANTDKSRFYDDYGFTVEFKVLDDFQASRDAFVAGEVDLLWCTIDAFPTEVQALRERGADPQVLFQADWSRGGDAIVVRRGINSVADLKGKSIAVAPMTPSHTFLLWLLEAGGLKQSDVSIKEQNSAIDAATTFKAKQVDAAVVWSPDDIIAVREVAGAKVLQSTRQASNIIADVFIAKRDYIEANREKLAQLYEGWMKGAAAINASEETKKDAAAILARGLNITEQDALDAINNVRLCTHGDNKQFFGLDPDYRGVTGEQLYTKMASVYQGLNYAPANVPGWRLISNPVGVSSAQLSGPEHAGEGQKTFSKADDSASEAAAIATKQVSIAFRTGEYQLDENAKYIIDTEFLDIAKLFANARIRIEGNTDNVGSRESNVALSKRRAQAVADYLAQEHSMDPNRFIVIGNGPDKPVADNGSDKGRAQNRRTDFELVEE